MRHDVTVAVRLKDGSDYTIRANDVADEVVAIMRAAADGIRLDGRTVTATVSDRPEPRAL